MFRLREGSLGLLTVLFAASCSLVLPWQDLSERSGAETEGGSETGGSDADGESDATGTTDTSADVAGEGSSDADVADGPSMADAGGSYCAKLRAGPNASTLRYCNDFDDGVLGEFVGSANTPHAIDPTSFLSPPNSVAFTRPVGKVGGHSDPFQRLILSTTVHRADLSVAINAVSPNAQSGFTVRLIYGNDTISFNVYGNNGVAATKSNNYPLQANRFINQWGTFRFLADFDAKTFRVFVNGIDEFGAALPLPISNPAPTSLSFLLEMYGNEATSMARWDNVSAFAE